MTTITLVKARSGLSISCKALGHSGFAKSGEDIVCSAVTILMRTALQVLSQASGIDFETDTEKMLVATDKLQRVLKQKQFYEKALAKLNGFKSELNQMQQEYSKIK